MENVKLNDNEYQIIKTLDSDGWRYYYTKNITQDNLVTILCKNLKEDNSPIEEVDDHEYPILMNKFALK